MNINIVTSLLNFRSLTDKKILPQSSVPVHIHALILRNITLYLVALLIDIHTTLDLGQVICKTTNHSLF